MMFHKQAVTSGALMALAAVLSAGSTASAQKATVTVRADAPGPAISPMLYGLFFEEINRAGDGGIYAEMVQNRSFEDAPALAAWVLQEGEGAEAAMAQDASLPLNDRNPHALKLQIRRAGKGVGVRNSGFRGMALRRGAVYNLSLYARSAGGFQGPLTVRLVDADGKSLASQQTAPLSKEWTKYRCQLRPRGTAAAGKLVIAAASAGTVWLDMVSLMPRDTWKERPNGLRSDLTQMLADIRPSFVRFPGGCYVEGDKLANAFMWKDSIGDVAKRPGHWNLWGYRSTDGLGYHEYLQMCEDLDAEPLFVINCGMAHKDHVPMEKMGEWVQDALDAIEYANGPAGSRWGALRGRNGHPEPFGLEYIEVGNENGGPLYQERYNLFYDAIKARYPKMHIVADVRTSGRPTEIVDEHYYNNPEFFIENAGRYDAYDRKGPKVYVGEYAVTRNCGRGNLRAAVAEAVFMMGMERNSDVVVMSSYAPLFVNVGWRQWNPDAINFDASRCYGTPSYHVQKMFSRDRGNTVLETSVQTPVVPVDASVGAGAVGVGTWATQAEFKDITVTREGKVVYRSNFKADGMKGWRPVRGDWKVVDGALRQMSMDTDQRAMISGLKLRDGTIELKARKIGGAEGFLILFQTASDQAKSWWNIGGWGNREHAVEVGGTVGKPVPGSVKTGRWYDIRIALEGRRIRCWLDGKLVHDARPSQVKALHAVASRDASSGDVILKAANVGGEPLEARIDLQGLDGKVLSGTATVLTSADPGDENSLDDPAKVAPVTAPLRDVSKSFRHTFPAHSVTVMRLKTAR